MYVLHAMWEVPVVLAKNDATMSTWAPPRRMAPLQRCLRANPVSARAGATIYKVPEEVADDLAGVGLFDIYIEEACNEAADWFLKHLSATE